MAVYRIDETIDQARKWTFMGFGSGKFCAARRGFLGLGMGAIAAAALGIDAAPPALAASDTAEKIADHFSGISSMTGEFVQFGPRGEQTGGKFFLQRPGKIRFNYEKPSPMRVISDGRSVVIGNMKLRTWDIYPLSKTPLALLLDERIDLKSKMVRDDMRAIR